MERRKERSSGSGGTAYKGRERSFRRRNVNENANSLFNLAAAQFS